MLVDFWNFPYYFFEFLPSPIDENSHLPCSWEKKFYAAKVLSDLILTLLLGAFKFRYWVFALKI